MEQCIPSTGKKRTRRRRKPFGTTLKTRYTKACFIMSKIKENERKGTPHEMDQIDRERCEIIIEEYLRYQRTQADMKKKEEQKGISLNKQSEVNKIQTVVKKEEPTKVTAVKNEISLHQQNEVKKIQSIRKKEEQTKVAPEKSKISLNLHNNTKKPQSNIQKEEQTNMAPDKKGISFNQWREVKLKGEISLNSQNRAKKPQSNIKKEEPTKMTPNKIGISLNQQCEVKQTPPIIKQHQVQISTYKIRKNNLCMALVNEKEGKLQPVMVSQWPMIEKRISDLQFKYNLHNKNAPIPRFNSGDIYRGYYLIQCQDEFSKEFLCNCITQVKDEFEGLSLNVIEIYKIPTDSPFTATLGVSHETLAAPKRPNSPPVWRKLSQSTSAADKHRYYLASLDRMKIFNAKRKLNQNERRNERKCRRAIRKYEQRNGLPLTQPVNGANGPPQKNTQGFQLSVNYFETDVSHDSRQLAGEFSQANWTDQTNNNNFPKEEQRSLNWGANSSWNSKEMEDGSNAQISGKSSFNRTAFGNNYELELEACGRPESTWNNSDTKTERLFERRQKSSLEFEEEKSPNSSWNFEESTKESKDFNSESVRNFDQEQNFRSHQTANGLWNDFNPEFESRYELRGNSSTNCHSPKPKSSARNNLETEETWRPNQMANTKWNYDNVKGGDDFNLETQNFPQQLTSSVERSQSNRESNKSHTETWNYGDDKGGSYGSPNPQFSRANYHLEKQNFPQHLSSSAEPSSSRNMMANSSWNNSEPAERSQEIKEPNKSNTEEESAKILLEKRIFELLNALSGDNIEEEHLKLPNKLPITQIELKTTTESTSQILGKRKSDLPPTEVITLTDDSDQEEEEKAEKEYFKALGFLKKLQGRNHKFLSEQEQFFKETSEFIVRQYQNKFGSKQEKTNKNQGKRTRWNSTANNNTIQQIAGGSSNNLTQTNNSVNPSATSLYTSLKTQPELQIAIIDRLKPDLSIAKHLWSQMEENLIKALHYEVEKTNNTNITQFDAMHWKYGVKVIQCENMEALNFIKRFIIKQTLQNPRQQYDVIPINELPKRSIVKVWIPPPNADDMAILKIIKAQNHTLYTNCWTLINSRERSNRNGKDLYISISAASVDRLRYCQGKIRYGINRLKMELPEEQDFGVEQ
ncbi:uncharacterized protein LOC119607002 [Lucilia sericata]|uniref:uncharacterized protein LOC119607002 n=1 Tax=Lucilia sericata TaxID=13632 RepID=UPI0018A862FD|nr:uncharacterized protein LOC119607002 [Lucilia sericata]XP_037816623.1 uncharacterized protein LOC119607002 [Lucilia sericata]